MNAIVHLKPRPVQATLIAWQFLGQPFPEWPSWVQSNCKMQRGPDGAMELCHARRSGAQVVYLDEWLVKDLDGGISYYTDAELRREFER
ncbi:MAG: hypothetical protein ABWY18_15575 [Tardiphaga sp.]